MAGGGLVLVLSWQAAPRGRGRLPLLRLTECRGSRLAGPACGLPALAVVLRPSAWNTVPSQHYSHDKLNFESLACKYNKYKWQSGHQMGRACRKGMTLLRKQRVCLFMNPRPVNSFCTLLSQRLLNSSHRYDFGRKIRIHAFLKIKIKFKLSDNA